MQPDNKVLVYVRWPKVFTREQADEVGQKVALLTTWLHEGQLLSTCQQAIVLTGERTQQELVADLSLQYLNVLASKDKKRNNYLVVPPRTVFDMGQEG